MNQYLIIDQNNQSGIGSNVWEALENAIGQFNADQIKINQNKRGYLWSPYISHHDPKVPRSSYECCTVNTPDGTLQLMQVFRSQFLHVLKELQQKYAKRPRTSASQRLLIPPSGHASDLGASKQHRNTHCKTSSIKRIAFRSRTKDH